MREHIFAESKRAFFLLSLGAAANIGGFRFDKLASFAGAKTHRRFRAFADYSGVFEILGLAFHPVGIVAELEFYRVVFVEL